MLLNLLTSESNNNSNDGGWIIWVIFGVAIIAMLVMNYFSNKKRKAQMDAEKEKRNAIKPGYKIVTIGGIVGTVVAVDDEANSFVLQTGTDENPSYLTFDKVAIYTAEDPNAPTETVEETEEENPTEEEQPVENQESESAPIVESENAPEEESEIAPETEEKAE